MLQAGTSRKNINLAQAAKAHEQTKNDRKTQGVYYTPPWLADYTVSKTLVKELANVADPACGCGAFIESLRRYDADIHIVGADYDSKACGITKQYFKEDSNITIRHENTLAGTEKNLYDAIVTNPPWGQKSSTFSKHTKQVLRERYRAAKGQFDLFSVFVERCLELLKPEGRFGFVLPEIFLLKNYPTLRKQLLKETTVDEIAHVGMAFQGVTMEAVVITGTNTPPKTDAQVIIRKGLRETSQGTTHTLPQSTFLTQPRFQFNTSLTRDTAKLISEFEDRPRLERIFNIHEGVHSGNVRQKLFRQTKPSMETAKVLVSGNELSPFQLNWKGTYIDLRPDLIRRDRQEYATIGASHRYTQPKLLVRRTGDRIQCALDMNNFYCSNNFFLLVPKEKMSLSVLMSYASLLNSPFYTWFFRTLFPQKGRAFAELKIHQLKQFPAFFDDTGLPTPQEAPFNRAQVLQCLKLPPEMCQRLPEFSSFPSGKAAP